MKKAIQVLVCLTIEGSELDAAAFVQKALEEAVKKGKGKKLALESRDIISMLRLKDNVDDWLSFKNPYFTAMPAEKRNLQ